MQRKIHIQRFYDLKSVGAIDQACFWLEELLPNDEGARYGKAQCMKTEALDLLRSKRTAGLRVPPVLLQSRGEIKPLSTQTYFKREHETFVDSDIVRYFYAFNLKDFEFEQKGFIYSVFLRDSLNCPLQPCLLDKETNILIILEVMVCFKSDLKSDIVACN